MPTFDFHCKACQATFEFSRPFGSKDQPKCPTCKSKRTEKLLSPPAIHFKGTGFYKTDSSKSVKAPVKTKSDTTTTETKTEAPKMEPKKEAPKSQNPAPQTSENKV